MAPTSPYEAERALNEMVLSAGGGAEPAGRGCRAPDPRIGRGPLLAPGYSARQQVTAERAARLLAACDAALVDDGASISSFEADRRARELRRLAPGAGEALGAAVSWLRYR